nr:MAG TPA: hypothetical protein [Caudoviricetes sp.]
MICYRGGSALRFSTRAHIRRFRPSVIGGSFYFPRSMI